MAERGLDAQARRQKAEAGLLPCPACGEWGDLRSGACVRCGEAVDWQAVTWQTGTWQVNLAFLLLSGAASGGLCWFILVPEGWYTLKLAAGFLMVPVGWLTYLNALRVARLVAWGLRQRGG